MAWRNDARRNSRSTSQFSRVGKVADRVRRFLWRRKRSWLRSTFACQEWLSHQWNLYDWRKRRPPERWIRENPARRGFSEYSNLHQRWARRQDRDRRAAIRRRRFTQANRVPPNANWDFPRQPCSQ